ncbi:twin-arginine translocase TatA/TatE family subunit [Streptomyces sp. AK08-02]|uniref:twin-arginine translocase TatA/TatE family subunit n=1 Tax=Streptomyces sp. AK08-02 TaxID=3028654 RepID=UPI0029B29BE0|nr:twin-arginine translocase TatA/TatE family subunit [Streptomyces sp. AK08-02]MDX3753666.1 twin-arginine translocase TatA/TatE family subunit [Streptomyces sp. AK08-02]
MFGLSELAVILIVVIAVLAAKKLPELARSAGKSARILKAEARAAKEDEKEGEGPESGSAPRVIQGETVTPGTGTPATETGRPNEGRGATPRDI